MSIPNASKYVIIGAGIHGLSTAYHLALEMKLGYIFLHFKNF